MIQFRGQYKFSKISGNKSIKDGMLMDNCNAVIREGKLRCDLGYHSDLVEYEWFTTSQVKTITPTSVGYRIETTHSVYILENLNVE